MTLQTTQVILPDQGFYVLQSPYEGLFWGPILEEEKAAEGKFISFDETEEVFLGKAHFFKGLDELLDFEKRPLKADFSGGDRLGYERRFNSFFSQEGIRKAVLYDTYRAGEALSLQVYLYLFEKLFKKSSEIKGYLYGFYDPKRKRAFLGLSPEFLFATQGNGQVVTKAVAGSQKASEFTSWSNKLLLEHEMVEESIKESLGKNVVFSEAQTIQYGDLVHLSSEGFIQGEVKSLSRNLHPTAAVGILPKDTSMNLDLGPSPRGFYGGYGELTNVDLPFSLVTIRGFEWRDDCLQVCVGGGVLHESAIDDEWNEINFKWEQFKKLWDL